jgi:hypothetical protein
MNNGHHIIVLLDANDDMRNSNSSTTLSQITLREAIMDRHGCTAPSTYKQNTSQTPIDGIWISPGLNIISGGYLPFDQLFQDTDQRCLWMDVSFFSAFGYKMPPIVKPKARRLNCRDPRLIDNFNQHLRKLIQKHNLLESSNN